MPTGAVRFCAACLLACLTLPAFAADPVLVRVQTKRDGTYVGELLMSGAQDVRVLDIARDVEVTVPKTDVVKLTNPVADDEAARTVGLPTLAAWQISKLPAAASKGKIAKVTPTAVYVTLKSGDVRPQQKVSVYRQKEEIRDPDTGALLAIERPRIAELQVTEVHETFSKAVLTGDLEVELAVGDEVELAGKGERKIAICPLSTEDGEETHVGTELAEDLTNLLVKKGMKVVERSELAPVLAELAIENTFLFEPKEAQKLGELTGASHVVVGKIVPTSKAAKAYMRLVDVATGEIRYAVSATVDLGDDAGPVAAASDSGARPGSKHARQAGLGDYAGPGSVPPTGRLVTSRTRLVPGMIVQAQWGSSSWYPVTIKAVDGDMVIVSWNGWGDRLEEVPRSKLALAPPNIPQPARAAREP